MSPIVGGRLYTADEEQLDAAYAVIRRLRGGWEPDIPCLGPEVWCWFHLDHDEPEALTPDEVTVIERTTADA